MINKRNFLEQFNKVFNSDNTIKPCGREACIKLIELANCIDKSNYYGNKDTGLLNVDEILSLRSSINVD